MRHWIAPEFAKLIDAERDTCEREGTLFTSASGIPLSPGTISKRWFKACKRVGTNVSFCQLRKIGSNAGKRHGGEYSSLMSEFWKAHAISRVTKSYEDGVRPAMSEAEKRWCDDLRAAGIL